MSLAAGCAPEGRGSPLRGMRALAATLSMIKFQHTLFALPFAFTGALLAAGGLPSWRRIGWILGAMVGAWWAQSRATELGEPLSEDALWRSLSTTRSTAR